MILCKAPATALTAPGYGRTVEEFDMAEVTWRPHPVYTGYEASSEGQVRSIDRYTTDLSGRCTRFRRGQMLKPTPRPSGYLAFSISQPGSVTTIGVHKFVCEAFHGLKPAPDLEVRHLNGDHLDNRPENLRWGTRAENDYDKWLHGTHPNAVKTHCKRGHEFTPENTYVRKAGRPGTGGGRSDGRNCLECKRQQERDRYREKVGRPVRRLNRRAKNGMGTTSGPPAV